MRPLPSKNFGIIKNKLAVKFHNGTAVVTGAITKQLGNKRFIVKKGTYQAVCTLAQTAADVTALQGGDTGICMIEFTPFGEAATYVRSIYNKTLIAHDGKRYSYLMGGTASAAGHGDIGLIPNSAPARDNFIVDLVATQGTPLSYAVPTTVFSDADGDALTLTATLSSGSALPTWLSFDGTTFSGTPAAGDVGVITVRVSATDGTNATTDDFTITVS